MTIGSSQSVQVAAGIKQNRYAVEASARSEAASIEIAGPAQVPNATSSAARREKVTAMS
jgi:hypothetical protein